MRQQAALAWSKVLTLIGHGMSNEVHHHAGTVFPDRELALPTSTVMAINACRLGAAYRFTPYPIVNSAAAA